MRYLLFVLMLIISDQLHATNYYFSMSTGNDSRSAAEAQNPSTPWRTLNKLNSILGILNAGDFVLLSRNDVFEGSILITKSGTSGLPITFGAYGSGAKPIISGLTSFNNWTSTGNGTWESPSPASSMVNVVLLNHAARPIGRWPNLNAANSGYLYYESYSGNSQITDNELPGSPNWTGGEVVIRKARWVIDRNPITQHSGNTIYYNSESGYGPSYKFGYFIQNHPATLDIPGEWYYKLNEKKLGIYSPSGNPSASLVEASTVDNLVSITGQSNITFDNISFLGANINAFNLINTQHIRITNCDINHSGLNAVNGANANDLTVENSIIDHTNNTALNLVDCSGLTARSNKIRNTGMIAGMGKGDAGAYEAILVNGDNETIEQNEIENTGYIPITFRGNVTIIRNNYINNFAMVKDDAAGIYTWNNIPNSPATYGSKISGNLILNGIGAGDGTEYPDYFPASGIYMDDNTANVEITNNSVANCGLFGMYIHNARNITITNNTLFNNTSQVVYRSDQHSTSPIRGIVMTDNVFFSKGKSQLTAEFSTDADDLGEFGISDNNYHVRPIDPGNIIYASYYSNGNFFGNAVPLDTWKGMFGKDINSKATPVTISSPDLIRLEYNPTLSSKTIPLDGTYVDAKNNTYNGSITLGPLSAAGLIKTGGGTPEPPTDGCGTGTILREQWNNIDGNDMSSIPLASSPNTSMQLTALETNNMGDSYAARIRGYICPPQNGSYTFFISGDDAAELYLSTDDNPANKTRIASLFSYSDFRQFDKYPSQRSAAINLVAGQRYYIEVLHKEGAVDDHVSVGWQIPGGATEIPIPGKRLSPYTNTTNPPAPSSGLNYRYYEGDWDWLPNFNAMSPVKTGTSPNVSLDVRNSNDHFGLVWEGMIYIPAAGNYTFETISDDGSNLYFNSFYSPDAMPLVDNSGLHALRSATGTIYIAAPGYYPIAMTYFEKGGDEVMQVLWSGPGIPRQPIPNEAFSRNMVASLGATSNPNSSRLLSEQGLPGNIFEFSATPNPFKSVATIRLTPEESGTASLEVIDLQGRLVQRVFNGNVQSGVPRVFQLHGDKLKSGVYIVRMVTGTKVVSKKIVLNK